MEKSKLTTQIKSKKLKIFFCNNLNYFNLGLKLNFFFFPFIF